MDMVQFGFIKMLVAIIIIYLAFIEANAMSMSLETHPKRNAYATMVYMGTPRDYEFYMAARVLLQSLANFKADADLIVIASEAIPKKWIQVLNDEDIIVKVVKDIPNPYANKHKFDKRFMFTLNKIYAWTLTEYERVVMLDADNLFLRAPDELFQCGEFCATFINPCIFHTGLFVLKPSNETFNNMLEEIHLKIPNKDGADQGFLTSHFNDLLDRPLFHPPIDGSERRIGLYRLPQGYQMDAGLYYLNFKWHVPCGINSVITFPSVPMLKPWYWWSYPTLPLGIFWHEKRRTTIGYEFEIYILMVEVLLYFLGFFIAMYTRMHFALVPERNSLAKSFLSRPHSIEQSSCHPMVLKALLMLALFGSYILPFNFIPTTVHPLLGWGVFLMGSFLSLCITINIFHLQPLPIIAPWIIGLGMFLIMLWPHHSSGISRSLLMVAYACFSSPFLWCCFKKLFILHDQSVDLESVITWTPSKSDVQTELAKIC